MDGCGTGQDIAKGKTRSNPGAFGRDDIGFSCCSSLYRYVLSRADQKQDLWGAQYPSQNRVAIGWIYLCS